MAKKVIKKMAVGGFVYTKAKRPQLGGVKKAVAKGSNIGKKKVSGFKMSGAKSALAKDLGDFGVKANKITSGAVKGALQKGVSSGMVKGAAFKPTPAPTKKATNLPAVTVTAKRPTKTVSQVWVEKTGRPWSEAKKLGMSDGSAKSNTDLLKKLNSGVVSKSSLNRPSDSFTKLADKNAKDEQEGRLKFPDAQPAMKRGGKKK